MTVLLVGALAGTATAKLPQFTHPAAFSSHRIVDGVSIGGVKLGMSKSRAIALWGKPDGVCRRIAPYDPDDRRRGCYYGGFMKLRKGIESGPPYAGFTHLPSGEVTSVFLGVDSLAGKASVSGRRFYDLAFPKVRAFKTDRGIRLRATMESARRAYGIPTPPMNEFGKTDGFRKTIVRRPQGCTVFWGNNASASSVASQRAAWTYVDKIEIDTGAWCPEDPPPPPPPPPE